MKISRRVKASRANGARSHGPKTPEGKLRSQTHAIRHGMLAKCVVLEGEDQEAFKIMMAELEERFHPVGAVELGMLEEMAAAYWRMRRGWNIEAELLNRGLRNHQSDRYAARLTDAFTADEALSKLVLLQRYESRLHRMYQRALNNLLVLREVKQDVQVSEEPDPTSEHSAEPQAESSQPVAGRLPILFPRTLPSIDRTSAGEVASPVGHPPLPTESGGKPAA